MIDWTEAGLWVVLFSVLMFVGSLVVLPMAIVSLPVDYFTRKTPRFASLTTRHPVLRWSVLVAKNLIGLLLIVAGLVMLVTPGQGLLAIFVGVMLLDVPGKRKLEREILCRPSILRLINRIRAKANRPPLEEADQDDQPD